MKHYNRQQFVTFGRSSVFLFVSLLLICQGTPALASDWWNPTTWFSSSDDSATQSSDRYYGNGGTAKEIETVTPGSQNSFPKAPLETDNELTRTEVQTSGSSEPEDKPCPQGQVCISSATRQYYSDYTQSTNQSCVSGGIAGTCYQKGPKDTDPYASSDAYSYDDGYNDGDIDGCDDGYADGQDGKPKSSELNEPNSGENPYYKGYEDGYVAGYNECYVDGKNGQIKDNGSSADGRKGNDVFSAGSPDKCAGMNSIGGICFPESGLSKAPIDGILTSLISWLLAIIGFIGLLAFLVSGAQYLLSYGDDDMIERAKTTMKWSIVGIAVAFSGFIVIRAIATLLTGSPIF